MQIELVRVLQPVASSSDYTRKFLPLVSMFTLSFNAASLTHVLESSA